MFSHKTQDTKGTQRATTQRAASLVPSTSDANPPTKIRKFWPWFPSSPRELRPRDVTPLEVAPGEWVRPLGLVEATSVSGDPLGTFNTVQAMWLRSSQPISPEHVKEAFVMLMSRTGVLQLCVGRRALWPWFRRVARQEVPFAVVAGDPLTAYSQVLHEPYDLARGPLWRARLLLGGGEGGCWKAGDINLDDDDENEDGEGGGEWRAVVMVAAQHCITDGFTNAMLCQDLLEALNGLATAGTAPPPPLRPLLPCLPDRLLGPRDWLCGAALSMHKLMTRLLRGWGGATLGGALPPPRVKAGETRVVEAGLGRGASRGLVVACRAAGVTVHSCVLAAAHLALLALARLHQARLITINSINLRRYYPGDLQGAAGCHVCLEEREVEVTTEHGATATAFWAFAAALQADLRHSLQQQRAPLRNMPMYRNAWLLLRVNSLLTRRGLPNRHDSHLITTNMGDYHRVLPGVAAGGGPLQAVHLLRSVSAHHLGHPFTLTFHTFRGRLLLSVDYFTNKVTTHAAQALIHHLKDILHAIATTGAPPPPAPPTTTASSPRPH